jgi:hypothetical protein
VCGRKDEEEGELEEEVDLKKEAKRKREDKVFVPQPTETDISIDRLTD